MDRLIERCAGLDVHKAGGGVRSGSGCWRSSAGAAQLSTVTVGLLAMRDSRVPQLMSTRPLEIDL